MSHSVYECGDGWVCEAPGIISPHFWTPDKRVSVCICVVIFVSYDILTGLHVPTPESRE